MKRAWLKLLRAEKSLTQAAVAVAAGLKPARYSRIEAGYCDLRVEEAQALARTFSQSLEFIQNGADTNAPKTATKKTPKANVAVPAESQSSANVAPLAVPAVAPKGLAAAASNHAPQPSAKGDDLADPKNFSLMPPTDALSAGTLPPGEFRTRLQQHIAFGEKVLHTSKVSPRIWVAWRDFNKEAQTLLRSGAPVPAASASTPQPTPPPAIAKVPTVYLPRHSTEKAPGSAKRGNKNVFGFFVEVAKESLGSEKYDALCAQATEAKKQQPEIGFMKHFKRLAEAQLPAPTYGTIAAEAERRFAT